jgi:hypothetical protein
MKRNTILKIAVVLLLFGSCKKDKLAAPSYPANISFKTQLVPIFTKDCFSCHGGSTQPNLKTNLYKAITSTSTEGTGVNVATPTGSGIYKTLQGKMAGKMSSGDVNLVLGWITQGAKNN